MPSDISDDIFKDIAKDREAEKIVTRATIKRLKKKGFSDSELRLLYKKE